MLACLAVTCRLHTWQNDRDLFRTTAITQGWKGYRNTGQHRKLWRRKFSTAPAGTRASDLSMTSPAFHHWTTPAPPMHACRGVCVFQSDILLMWNLSLNLSVWSCVSVCVLTVSGCLGRQQHVAWDSAVCCLGTAACCLRTATCFLGTAASLCTALVGCG